MSEKANLPKDIIFAATLPPSLARIGLLLATRDGGITLELSQQGEHKGDFRVPSDLSKQDLPYWIAAILRMSMPGLNEKALDGYVRRIRRRFQSDERLLTLCFGPKARFHECCILHIDLNYIQVMRRKTTVSVMASVEGLRFILDKELLKWTFIFRTSSELAARRLERRIRPSSQFEKLVWLDGEVTGVMALNADRWETAGYSSKEVMKFAIERNISLKELGKIGCGLSFRVRGR